MIPNRPLTSLPENAIGARMGAFGGCCLRTFSFSVDFCVSNDENHPNLLIRNSHAFAKLINSLIINEF